MNWKILGNKVQALNGGAVEFLYPVKEAEEVAGVLIVVLQVPPKESMTENVFKISAEGKIIWTIERIRETATDPVDRYVGVSPQRQLGQNWELEWHSCRS